MPSGCSHPCWTSYARSLARKVFRSTRSSTSRLQKSSRRCASRSIVESGESEPSRYSASARPHRPGNRTHTRGRAANRAHAHAETPLCDHGNAPEDVSLHRVTVIPAGYGSVIRQQRLYLRSLPHGHGSLAPIFGPARRTGSARRRTLDPGMRSRSVACAGCVASSTTRFHIV